MRLILKEQLKYLQSFINNATYHPMNSIADITYQTVNLVSSGKYFICFISDYPHYIWWNFIIIPKYKHIIAPYALSTSIFTRIVQTVVLISKWIHYRCTQYICGAMICSYFGIIFVLLFKKIENAVYTCFQNSMLLFINGFIFDIMNIQNNQSLEFEWVPMLAPFIRSVNDWRFPRLAEFCSVMPGKLYKRCWPENVHIDIVANHRWANIWKIENKCYLLNHWSYPISSLTSG